MRSIAPILLGLWLVVPVALAESPSALQLPPTLHFSDTGGAGLEELAVQLDDLESDREAGDLQLKDLILGLEVVGEKPRNLDLELQPVDEQPLGDEGLAAINRSQAERPETRKVRPSSYDESLGEKIRGRANAEFEEMDLGTARGDKKPPADRLDDENAFDAGYFNDVDAAESRERSALGYLKELRKPVTAIRIEIGEPNKDTPPNLARLYAGHEASIPITASGAMIPLPDRYTIGFSHRPLYYEELDLERCGLQHGCLQYEVSCFHFFFNTLVLPYCMATQCPDQLVCTHGDCQTCQYYPCEIEPLRLNGRAVIAETAAIAGFTFLLL